MVLFDIFRVTVLAANLMSNLVKSVERAPNIFSQLQNGSEKVFIRINRLTEARLQIVIISILVSLTETETSVFWVAVSFR